MLAHGTLLRRAFMMARHRQAKVLASKTQSPRPFTQNAQLLILSRGIPRPQLPFLHPRTAGRPSAPPGQTQSQLTRLLSSESTGYYQDIINRSMKLSAIALAGMLLYGIARFMLWKETMEREFPAPPEWHWRLRWCFSKAASDQIPSDEGRVIDWAHIGSLYEDILQALEDPQQEGKDVRPLLADDGEFWVAGVSKAGLDISEKSEHWRRGYHACLMGAAKAAEQLDGWVYDTTTNMACPGEFVIGPSNPTPKPWPHSTTKPPLEENCRMVLPSPEALYIKIITSQGFTSRQRLEAALAYGDWLDFKGLTSTAEDMYDWALDIAAGALPMGANGVVDVKTGVINSKATYVSANILIATTALANHHARHNNLAAALPIFLSVLRARRHLLLPPPPPKGVKEQHSSLPLLDWFTTAKDWLTPPPYPPPPPTGDEIPSRTPAEVCEEAAVMSSIGEVLFASSSLKKPATIASDPILGPQIPTASTTSQLELFQSGLSWNRDAVDVAEETLDSLGYDDDDEEARTKCMQCLQVGMQNWSQMVERMLQDERAAKKAPKEESRASRLFWGVKDIENDNQNRWEGEARVVDSRIRRIKRLLASEQDRQRPLWMRILGKQRDF